MKRYIRCSDVVTEDEYYEVDLRSRKTGDTVEVIYSGPSYDEAWAVRNEWMENNFPDWDDNRSIMDLWDGSDGVFPMVYQLEKGETKYGVGKLK